MVPFYGGGSTVSRLESHCEEIVYFLPFIPKFPVVPGTQSLDLERMKDGVDLGATQRYRTWNPWIGNSSLDHQANACFNLSPRDVEIISTYFSVGL